MAQKLIFKFRFIVHCVRFHHTKVHDDCIMIHKFKTSKKKQKTPNVTNNRNMLHEKCFLMNQNNFTWAVVCLGSFGFQMLIGCMFQLLKTTLIFKHINILLYNIWMLLLTLQSVFIEISQGGSVIAGAVRLVFFADHSYKYLLLLK